MPSRKEQETQRRESGATKRAIRKLLDGKTAGRNQRRMLIAGSESMGRETRAAQRMLHERKTLTE